MAWTWNGVTNGLGWPVAFIIGILAIIFWVQGTLPKEWAMGILAVCAVRL